MMESNTSGDPRYCGDRALMYFVTRPKSFQVLHDSLQNAEFRES